MVVLECGNGKLGGTLFRERVFKQPMNLLVDKYRPKELSEVVGNKDTLKTLSGILSTRSMPHLLFTGPPGTGKTTCAKILATKILEGSQDALLELNASDDRGIDVVRTKIKYFAQKTARLEPGQFKLVILDEADSMTTAAQQAMRRVMELYVETTRFILICNTFTKIFEPIQSRCAVLRFDRLEDTEIKSMVLNICKEESIKLDAKALDMVVKLCEGDMRQSLNILQSVAGLGEVCEKTVEAVTGQPSPVLVGAILDALQEKDIEKVLALLDEVWAQKYEPGDIIGAFFRAAKYRDNYELLKCIGVAQLRLSEGNDVKLQLYGMLHDILSIEA